MDEEVPVCEEHNTPLGRQLASDVWRAVRIAFLAEAERYCMAETAAARALIVDTAPQVIFKAMNDAARKNPA